MISKRRVSLKQLAGSSYFWLLLILLTALILRLYKLDSPIADFHSWKQVDAAAAARFFHREGIDLLRPRNVVDYKDNPSRLNILEFPLYPAYISIWYAFFGESDQIARLATIAISLGSIVFIYLLGKHFFNRKAGLFAAFFYAINFYFVFYNRAIFSENLITFTGLVAVYAFARYFDNLEKNLWLALGALAFVITVVVKAYSLVLILPIVFLGLTKLWEDRKLFSGRFWFYASRMLAAALIFGLGYFLVNWWMRYAASLDTGGAPSIAGNRWLFNSDGIRFRPAFFWWLIQERIGKLLLTLPGFALATIGMLRKQRSLRHYFLFAWAAGLAFFFVYVATGNVRHEYYQLPLGPVLALWVGLGAEFLAFRAPAELFHKYMNWLLLALFAPLIMFLSFYVTSKSNYPVSKVWIREAEEIKAATPPESQVIVVESGDSTVNYLADRIGYSVFPADGWAYQLNVEDLEKMRKQGADFLAVTDTGLVEPREGNKFGRYLEEHYRLVYQGSTWIYDLRADLFPPK